MKSLNLYALAIMDNMMFYPSYYGALSGEKARVYKPHEAKSLVALVQNLMENGVKVKKLDNFFYGYIIPQIGKEFDILKIGSNVICNIELKSFINDLKDAKEQLIKNKFYLSHLSQKQYFFTFNSYDNTFYTLDDDNNFKVCSIEDVIKANDLVINDENVDIDKLFSVSRFIVSPITSPIKFLKGEYFLTQQQQIIRKKVISAVYSKKCSTVKIGGSPGTGKTLLLYDIALSLAENKKICFVIWGKVTDSHKIIEENIKNIKFVSVFNLEDILLENFDLIIADETQRYSNGHFEKIISFTRHRGNRGIIAFEKQDILFKQGENPVASRMNKVPGISFVLSGKIRVNEDLSNFILRMFDRTALSNKCAYKAINVYYSANNEQTKQLLELDFCNNYTHIVDDVYKGARSRDYILSFNSVGKEFDNVVVVIDENYRYNGDGKLSVNNKFPGELYLAVTRARKNLSIIVENNQKIFEYLVELINKNNK